MPRPPSERIPPARLQHLDPIWYINWRRRGRGMGHIELGIVTGVVNLLNVDASKTKETHLCIASRCEWPFWFFRLRPIKVAWTHSCDIYLLWIKEII